MANLRANNLSGSGGRNAIDGSVFFEGESSYLEMASGALISGTGFGTNDFTIEFWINQGVNASNYTILFAYTSSTNLDRFEVAMHSSTIQVYTHTGAWRDTGYAPVSGQWEHIAFVRNYSGNTLKMYANGVEKWSVSNNHDYNEAGVTQIGSYGSASYGYFEGFISNLRVVNGTALYTANFTPPTEKLTVVPNTVLLCCQDSDDATQEATGKTITGYGRYFAATGEKFANTGFTADSDWDKGAGWTISGGVATHAQGSAGDLAQQISGLVVGQTYKISVDILTTDNDVAYFFVDNNPGGNYPPLTGSDSSPVGNHFIYFNANATTMWLGFRGSSLWAGTLTNLRLSSADRGKSPKVLPSVGVDEGVVFEGDTKVNTQGYMYFPTGDTAQRGRGVGLYAGGTAPGADPTAQIASILIQSMGNSVDWGDLSVARYPGGTGASATRGIWAGGATPTRLNTIDYVTIATTGTAQDFGDSQNVNNYSAGASNQTRMVSAGGDTPTIINVIDLITIATTGNASDFGDLTVARVGLAEGASPTRGVFAGGWTATPAYTPNDTIDYVTIGTTGNATDFGNLTSARRSVCGGSSQTRAVFMGGLTGSVPSATEVNTIDYVTIATTGNATDFGDMTATVRDKGDTMSNTIRVCAAGGYDSPATVNSIDMVTVATTGNAVDFGDTVIPVYSSSGLSDSHGGLS